MSQASFWPVPLSEIRPLPEKTAHCEGIGIGPKGERYAVKFGNVWPKLPLNEVVCHALSKHCGIVLPPWHVVEDIRTGRLGFGSAWLEDVCRSTDVRWSSFWQQLTPKYKAFFSACCALDGFVHNDDRHLRNFLLSGSGVLLKPFAGDYSCAWWMKRWDCLGLQRQSTNSIQIYTYILRKPGLWDSAAAELALSLIGALETRQVYSLFNSYPQQWLEKEHVEQLLEWWDCGFAERRANMLIDRIHHARLPL